MHVALITDGIFPYVMGGMQKHSYYLVKYLAKNKVYVDLYHTNKSEYDISKLEFFSGDEKKFIRSFVIPFPDFGKLPGHYIRESFMYSVKVFQLFKDNKDVDFVYAKGFSAWKLLDEKRKGFTCPPVGVNFHGYEMFQKVPTLKLKIALNLLLKKPVMFNIENSDYVFSYGGKVSEIILKLGISKEKLIEVPAGIESDWINEHVNPTRKKRKFVFVGRYERRKGIEELNKALKTWINSSVMEMHFIGPVPKSKQLTSKSVFYYGSVNDANDIKLLLRSSDILICPSYSEGMPNVILEAMASGLAIIASDVGAVNLMVSKKNGWLISPGNTNELRIAMEKALNISDLHLDNMKMQSKVDSNKFLWNDIALKLLSEIKKRIVQHD